MKNLVLALIVLSSFVACADKKLKDTQAWYGTDTAEVNNPDYKAVLSCRAMSNESKKHQYFYVKVNTKTEEKISETDTLFRGGTFTVTNVDINGESISQGTSQYADIRVRVTSKTVKDADMVDQKFVSYDVMSDDNLILTVVHLEGSYYLSKVDKTIRESNKDNLFTCQDLPSQDLFQPSKESL